MSYQAEFERAKRDPEVFWREQANLIEWSKAPQTILAETAQGATQWYPDGELNTAYLALDYHVKNGRGDQLALIYDSPVAEDVQKFTYRELTERVALFAGVLRELGVGKGDRVIIYLPMIPEAAIAMLACARLGAVHSVVFGGFAPKELATRIDDALPKIIVSASCGIEFSNIIPYKPLLDEAQNLASHKVSDVVLFQRKQHVEVLDRHYRDWAELLVKASPADCVPVKSNDPLYILYTSGTTGKPKGVVRDNGGHAVAMRYSMQAVYDVGPGDVFWAASDVGWVVGHSYIV
jgi:propionyl-CoA synthetase